MKVPYFMTVVLLALVFANPVKASDKNKPNYVVHDNQYTKSFEFRYNQRKLFELGALETPEEMIQWLEKDGVVVLSVDGSESKWAAEAEYYKSRLPDLEKVAGVYVPAYEITGPGGSPFSRPFGGAPIILLKNKKRQILLHEYLHHLIEEHKVKQSGLQPLDFYEKRQSVHRWVSEGVTGNTPIWDQIDVMRAIIVMDHERVTEEIAINSTLLHYQKELGLKLRHRTLLLQRLQDDFDQYMKDTHEQVEHATKVLTGLGATVEEARAVFAADHLDNLRNQVKQIARRAIRREPAGEKLLQVAAEGIHMQRFEIDSDDPWKVLGLRDQYLNLRQVEAALEYWRARFDTNEEQLQAMERAGDKIEEHRQEFVEISKGNFAAKRFFNFLARVGGACAIGAAYCAFDQSFPWAHPLKDMEFDFLWVTASSILSTIYKKPELTPFPTKADSEETIPVDDMKRPVRSGLAQGGLIGTGIAACWEAMKLFF